ncbi:MAG: septum formation initiator family protein [Nitrospirae bacterium]|nr:septum formation initiator family protein [Nitrospirota bacterium]
MKRFAGNLNLTNKQKKWAFFGIAGAVSIYIIISFLFYDIGFIKYIKMRGEFKRVSADIKRLKEENSKLRGEVKSLKTDPDYIEAFAREKLGLAKEGEIIYRFEDKDKKGGGR